MVSFGALLAMMIATVGDEAFVMLAMIPGTSLYLFTGLLILAIVSGWITDKVIPGSRGLRSGPFFHTFRGIQHTWTYPGMGRDREEF
jgi:hypothetical protein